MDASTSTDARPVVSIHLAALRANLGYVRRTIGPARRLYAVVKANAYGHGVDVVAPAVADRVDGFVVVNLDEAYALRALQGLADQKIIVLQPIEPALHSPDAIARAVAGGLTLVPGSLEGLHAIAAAARRLGRVADVQLHLDTGLRRCGVDLATADALACAAVQLDSIRWTDVSTHAAHQDLADVDAVRQQLAAFGGFVDRWRPRVPGLIAHAAASGLALLCPESRFDAVRVGAAMYGIEPLSSPHADHPLRPALRMTAPVLAIRDLHAGDGVGYGHTFVARRSMRVAVLPVGYFDGFPRAASNRARVMIDGIACRTLGTVSMDLLIVDVSRCPGVRVSSVAAVIEDDSASPASAAALAKASGTVTYEILARLGPRPRRVVVEDSASAARPAVRLDYVRREMPSVGRVARFA